MDGRPRRLGGCTGALCCTLALAASGAAAEPEQGGDGEPEAGVTKRAEGAVGEEVIVVTGTRSETPRSGAPVTTEVIDRQRLVESGVQTAAEALALRPGLWLDRG